MTGKALASHDCDDGIARDRVRTISSNSGHRSCVKQLSAVLLAIEGSCWQLPHPLSFYLPPTTYFFHHLLTAASPCALLMHTQRLLTCDCAHSVQQRYIVS